MIFRNSGVVYFQITDNLAKNVVFIQQNHMNHKFKKVKKQDVNWCFTKSQVDVLKYLFLSTTQDIQFTGEEKKQENIHMKKLKSETLYFVFPLKKILTLMNWLA